MADSTIPQGTEKVSATSNTTSNSPSVTAEEKTSKAQKLLGVEGGQDVVYNADDELLMTLGYAPELKREYSYFTVFGQSFGAMGIAPAIAESLIFSLGSAGSVGMVWTYFVGCILLIPVSLSLGELGSSMPTAGGLYYVSHRHCFSCRHYHGR
jgi:hypothetical protein